MKAKLVSWALVACLCVAPFAAGAATGSIGVCADPAASAEDAAFHCRRALAEERLSQAQRLGANLNLGEALISIGQPDLAVDAFNAAAAIDPNRVDVYIGRARALEGQGMRGNAAADWDRALGLARDSVDVRLGRGAFYLRGADPSRAIEEFSAALRLDSREPDALYNRGISWLVLGRPIDAERDFTKLLRDYPSDAAAHYHRARARAGRDDGGALADFDKASALAPEWSAPWFLKGRLLDRLGRRAEADRSLRRAFELGHQDPWLLERIQRLGG